MTTKAFEIKASGMIFSALEAGPSDGPLVLCLHGFPQFADAWIPYLLTYAAKGFHAVAVDQRGYARYARPSDKEAYVMEELCGDVFNIADALKADHFHLVGHDWGGVVGWHIAAMAPKRLLSLTVLSVPHPKAFSRVVSSSWDQRLRSSYVLLFKAPFHLAERVLTARDWKLLRSMYQGKVSADAIARNIARLSEDDGLTKALNWYRAYGSHEGESVGEISVPTLYIRGTKDVALGPEAAELTTAYVKGDYKYVELKGYTHWLIDENPKHIIEIVLSHLQVRRQTFDYHFKAPLKKVFQSFVKTNLLKQWRVPDEMTMKIHRFEPRSGGRFRVSLRYKDADAQGKSEKNVDTYSGHFETLMPNQEIVEVIRFESSDRDMAREMRIHTRFEADANGTRVRAIHMNIPDGIRLEDNEMGWKMAWGKLEHLLEKGPS